MSQQFVGINGEQTGLGFTNRDQGAKVEEDQGLIDFKIITNNGTHESMKMLIDLKNIFARQLPKMPKEYIVRLVFDRNHESMCIIKDNTKVIGGICYRKYPTQRFAEIAFLAITATLQVKGYGTRLMNKFKEHIQKQDVEYLLTYADNYAIGYFRKQGFYQEIKMQPDRWKGFIKDYDGGTLMECYVHPIIDYGNISDLIREQKQQMIDIIKKLTLNDRVYPGLDKQNYKVENSNSDKPTVKPESIQGILESGWTIDDYNELKKQKEKTFMISCQQIIDTMRKHKSAWPFLDPVNKDDVPDYYDVITDPIDIKTIEKKLQSNQYTSKDLFIKDVKRIFTNCRNYNQPDTIYYKCANELERSIDDYLKKLKDEQQIPGVSKKIKKTNNK
ncbi:unnamed protein product [Paramecium pentaurelia]|uniref:histone acetyltransferase n=1 Tax=Paramecium pentaurelia TaxID=43138 RepID=A0A8S1UCT8_9CILI|nr:unnamed protein product [Paramecium pentaurelia]